MDEVKERIADLTDDELKESLLLSESGFQPGVYGHYLEEAKKRKIQFDKDDNHYYKKDDTSFFAPQWKRFVNYVIDFGIAYILPLRLLFYKSVRAAEFSPVFALLILLFVIATYYTVCEYFLGKTLGKYITRTTVTNLNAKKPKFGQIVAKTISRLIPFNSLLTLITRKGIHDRLSRTICIEDKRIPELETVKQ